MRRQFNIPRLALLTAGAALPFIHSIAAQAAAEPPIQDRYALAERFLTWHRNQYLLNAPFEHHWIGNEDRFWYRQVLQDGSTEFKIVDAHGATRAAFDQRAVAAGLTARGLAAQANRLPFTSFEFQDQERRIEFDAGAQSWSCATQKADCRSLQRTDTSDGVLSPDGKWLAFLKDWNIWLRATNSGQEQPLTRDGAEHYAYGVSAGNSTEYISSRRLGGALRPLLVWSPDSRRLLTQRVDEREVAPLYLLQSVPPQNAFRPKLHEYRYSFAGDPHKARESLVIIELADHRQIPVRGTPAEVTYQTTLEAAYAWWEADGSLYRIAREPYARGLRLERIDAASGATQLIVHETGEAYVEIAAEWQLPRTRILHDGQVIWFSERDGYGHLYLYDHAGRLERQLTQGAWNVRDIVRVDERNARIFFTASGREPGRNPYLRRLYSIGLDGKGLTLLTPEDADHDVHGTPWDLAEFERGGGLEPFHSGNSFSASGRFFIETYSRPDLPPVTVLRSRDGKLKKIVSRADLSKLEQGGFTLPEPFEALAADGKTPLYGVLFKPSHFDPQRRYPVLDSIYPGPQERRVSQDFVDDLYDRSDAQAIAELGFLVVAVDGRGTPQRSKTFLNYSYGKLGLAGTLEDHVVVIKQLARRYPGMDLDRVGIYGHSGGGYAAAHAILSYPEFFKVAVASSGNHDQRLYVAGWGETYNGPDDGSNYRDAANAALAGQLQGKLLLAHGDMDDNVHPAQTLRLVDALIRQNKNFDLLIVPNANHDLHAPYFVRRRWDYFVEHLLGIEPPPYSIKAD